MEWGDTCKGALKGCRGTEVGTWEGVWYGSPGQKGGDFRE